MNMAGMNPAGAGGPVGGNMMMMNNGSPAMMQAMETSPEIVKEQLNTYIYEYLIKSGLSDVARSLLQKQDMFKMRTDKGSPNSRKNGDVNGIDPDAMDMDLKMDFPNDMPRPQVPAVGGPNGFLYEWFSMFSDLYQAHNKRNKIQGGTAMNPTAQYLMHTQSLQRMRESQQGAGLGRGGMAQGQFAMQNMQRRMANGVAPGDTRKSITPQQMQHMQQLKMIQQSQNNAQQMRGDQGDVDMNGRPGSPQDGENGGSPSKRPRLENQQFNGGMIPNGRPMQAVPPQGMMIQSGFNPQMNQAPFRQNGAMGQKIMQPNMTNGMNMINSAGSQMMPGINNSQFGDGMAMEMYNQAHMGTQPMQAGSGAANSGNHALQDYQMQLMLLEQQNKKRLMMARQEQDNAVNRDGAPMPAGMAGGMSPSGRSGTSPNPTDQPKRNPQLGGLPSSPAAGENMQGRSPGPMFMNGIPPGDFNPTIFMPDGKTGMGGPGGPGMRPPTSVNMGQQGRMGGQFQGGQPMVQNPSQGGQLQMGTPGQRNDMPPPQAPAGGSAQRNQPSSPAPSGNALPTPSQSNKAPAKSKKAKDAANANNSENKKRPNKKSAQANTSGDTEPPATPTPSTPITSQHPNSFNGGTKGQAPNVSNAPQAAVQQMPPSQQSMQQPDMGTNFGEFGDNQNFNLDFSTLENTDVLENFDFDSFLNTTTDDAFNFDGGMVGGDFDLNTDG